MTRSTHSTTRPLLAALGATALAGAAPAALADIASLPFSAVVDGQSRIVEVINPSGPVVRVSTEATGTASGAPLGYFSGDVLDLGTGQGTGTNRFVTADGELFGSFTVQFIPGADASLFSLIGQMVFTGGTGAFLGASGSGSFEGNGQFVSASLANTHFSFVGDVSAVPEPGTALLGALGLGLASGWARHRVRATAA
jgi:hypothetical protein